MLLFWKMKKPLYFLTISLGSMGLQVLVCNHQNSSLLGNVLSQWIWAVLPLQCHLKRQPSTTVYKWFLPSSFLVFFSFFFRNKHFKLLCGLQQVLVAFRGMPASSSTKEGEVGLAILLSWEAERIHSCSLLALSSQESVKWHLHGLRVDVRKIFGIPLTLETAN